MGLNFTALTTKQVPGDGRGGYFFPDLYLSSANELTGLKGRGSKDKGGNPHRPGIITVTIGGNPARFQLGLFLPCGGPDENRADGKLMDQPDAVGRNGRART